MINTVTPLEFHRMFPAPAHIYNSVAFAEHNRQKCDDNDVRYLTISDSKVRAGVVLGRRGDTLHTPFSAPFGGLLTNRRQCFEIVERIWHEIADYVGLQGLRLRVTLPPTFIDSDLTVKSVNILQRMGFAETLDVSYHIDLADDICAGMTQINKLRQALRTGAEVAQVAPTAENIERVYRIVEANHFSKNRPVRMELSDVIATAPIVHADFFILTHSGVDIAAAMVYPVAEGIVQVVYWADMPGYSDMRPMNLLAYHVLQHYKSAGFHTFDLGPATEDGTPNYGLCVFKESLGAFPTIKYTFTR